MKEKRVKKILKASYLNQKEASHKLENLGYKYDPELSSNENKVFVDRKGNPNIAFRGTKTGKDVVSDVLLGLGLDKYDTRFKEAKHLTKLVEDKYEKPVNVFGSSLGGSIAEKAGGNGSIYTHNKGVGIGDLFKSIPNNQTDYRNKNDVVSLGALTQSHSNNNLKNIETGNKVLDVFGNHKIL